MCFSKLNRATLLSHVALSREGPGPCGGDPGPGTIYIPRPLGWSGHSWAGLGRARLAWDLSSSSLMRSRGPGSGLKKYRLDNHGQGQEQLCEQPRVLPGRQPPAAGPGVGAGGDRQPGKRRSWCICASWAGTRHRTPEIQWRQLPA